MSIQEIKRKISSIKKTSKITNAMALVSTSKYNKMIMDQKKYRVYAQELENMVQRLFSYGKYLDLEEKVYQAEEGELSFLPYVLKKDDIWNKNPGKAYLVISSDKGLAGSYNSQILSRFERELAADQKAYALAIGQPVVKYCQSHDIEVVKDWFDIDDEPDHRLINEIVSYILALFQEGKINAIDLIFNDLVNPLQTQVICDTILPIGREDYDPEVLRPDYIFEPDVFGVIDQLIEMYIESALWDAILRAKTAEHASRMQAMQQATDNADKLIEDLQSDYHQARQLSITNEMIEVISGSNAQIEED